MEIPAKCYQHRREIPPVLQSAPPFSLHHLDWCPSPEISFASRGLHSRKGSHRYVLLHVASPCAVVLRVSHVAWVDCRAVLHCMLVPHFVDLLPRGWTLVFGPVYFHLGAVMNTAPTGISVCCCADTCFHAFGACTQGWNGWLYGYKLGFLHTLKLPMCSPFTSNS